jgi:hypothetical protein
MECFKYWLGLAVSACCLAAGQLSFAATDTAPATDCVAPTNWFSGKSVPRPDAGNGAQFNSNCAFHQFSWQAFLWLTEAAKSGKLRFETLYSERAIDPHIRKPRQHVLGGVKQADSLGILVDQNGRAVYTTMMIDEVYRDFVVKNKLYTSQGMQNADPTLVFPNGALSLKAAWKIIANGDDTSRFYTTTARIQLLGKVGDGIGIPVRPKTITTRVALVGLHVVEVVSGHPEAIWATFEHVDNAPDFNTGQTMSGVVSDKSFTFYKAGTTAGDCNPNNASIVQLDAKTQKLAPITQTCRQFRNGGGAADNMANIDSINRSVLSQLPANSIWRNYREVGAIWFNKSNALTPDWNPNTGGSLLTGSTLLSSSVIETFTQNTTSRNECFSCHNTMAVTDTNDLARALPGKNISTSHILLQKYLKVASVKR